MAPKAVARDLRRRQALYSVRSPEIPKCPTGIQGLDELTLGGLPRDRATLVSGPAGSGKTLLAAEFLVRGALQFKEPGLFLSFEESHRDFLANGAAVGLPLRRLIADRRLAVDCVALQAGPTAVGGEFSLDGLFIRLEQSIRQVRARRIVLDSLDGLFAGLPHPATIRTELRRLFRWLGRRRLTTIVTAEGTPGALTRHGIEEFLSDCVITVDHRVKEQISTRRLRVVKYRGSAHGTNEYPFLIGAPGLSVVPITSLGLGHTAPRSRVSSGLPGLDRMLDGRGFYRASTVLVTGSAGSGKTSLATTFAAAACRRRERALVLALEESPAQIERNMRSIGLDLAPHLRSGRLRIVSSRPQSQGLEHHLVELHKLVGEFRPSVVVVDPVSDLVGAGTYDDARAMLTRLIDYLKQRGTTTLFTSLVSGPTPLDASEIGISSLVDTWIRLQTSETADEELTVRIGIVKSRGMPHARRPALLRMDRSGLHLLPVEARA